MNEESKLSFRSLALCSSSVQFLFVYNLYGEVFSISSILSFLKLFFLLMMREQILCALCSKLSIVCCFISQQRNLSLKSIHSFTLPSQTMILHQCLGFYAIMSGCQDPSSAPVASACFRASKTTRHCLRASL